ncbi:MAG TPA: DUF1294 domain-containing protein [Caulobacteraceae bacterium]|nr:DUF1294 domain-containing protein [Caulobacteraceae bacterium]
MSRELALYLASINLATFAAFWADKQAAVHRHWRIAERTLLMLTALGGWAGALGGQLLLRHKTRKEPFRTLLWFIIAIEALALIGWSQL